MRFSRGIRVIIRSICLRLDGVGLMTTTLQRGVDVSSNVLQYVPNRSEIPDHVIVLRLSIRQISTVASHGGRQLFWGEAHCAQENRAQRGEVVYSCADCFGLVSDQVKSREQLVETFSWTCRISNNAVPAARLLSSSSASKRAPKA